MSAQLYVVDPKGSGLSKVQPGPKPQIPESKVEIVAAPSLTFFQLYNSVRS